MLGDFLNPVQDGSDLGQPRTQPGVIQHRVKPHMLVFDVFYPFYCALMIHAWPRLICFLFPLIYPVSSSPDSFKIDITSFSFELERLVPPESSTVRVFCSVSF